jgi:hypothetical protein
MDAAFSKCAPVHQAAIQEASTIPEAPKILAMRAHSAYLLRALATLQLKHALKVYRSYLIDFEGAEYFLKQAGGDDPSSPYYSPELHKEAQAQVFACTCANSFHLSNSYPLATSS